jgi:exodeoxyribonuclease VII small subunit
MMSDSAKDSSQLKFGEALDELDAIVEELERGELELEESIDQYQRGVDLLKALQTKLSDAQQKVTMLIGELEAEAGSAELASASDSTSEEVPF